MGFGNFIRGIVAQVNPFDDGATYGTYNPPKKRDDTTPNNNQNNSNPAPAQNSSPSGLNPQIKAQTPQNLFAGLNNNLRLPGSPQNNVPVQPSSASTPVTTPPPGTVVKPSPNPQIDAGLNAGKSWQQIASDNNLSVDNVRSYSQATRPNYGITPAAPKVVQNGQNGSLVNNHFVPDAPVVPHPGVFGQIGNVLKTAGETALGTVANVPEVALAAARAGSGLAEGLTQLPHMVTAGAATATQGLDDAFDNRFTRGLNRGTQDINTGVKNVTNVVDSPLDMLNRGLDTAADGYAAAMPGASSGTQVYKTEQVPMNILAALLTGGASASAEAASTTGDAANVGKLAQFSRFVNSPLVDNTDNVVAKTAQAVSNKVSPIVQAINSPISTAKAGINNLLNNPVVPTVARDATDAGEIGNILSESQLQDLTKPPIQIPVSQPHPIPVEAPPSEPIPIPVANNTPQGAIIRETSKDAPNVTKVPTSTDVATQRATNAFDNQAPGLPDQSVSGMNKPSDVITNADKQDYQSVLDDKLATGKITPDQHVDLSNQLAKVPAQDAPIPKGEPIAVKQVDNIPVENRSVVPTGLPETPGTVRATVATAPKQAKSAEIASENVPIVEKDVATTPTTPTATTPAQLPKDVQNVLDNPKQFNKVQVAAARNQRKLAVQMAKAKEATAAAVDRIDTASPAHASGEGLVSTGEFDKGAGGNVYEKAHRATETAQAVKETASMSPGDAIKTARVNQAENDQFNDRDIRNVKAMLQTKRIVRGTPEYNEAMSILKEDGSHAGARLGLRNGGSGARQTASSDRITSQYESKIYRMVDDPSKIDSTAFDKVDAAESKFTDARDGANMAGNRFTESPTHENAKAFHAAQDAADAADRQAKMTEYTVAKSILKGNKDPKQVAELQKMAQSADAYQMDHIDSAMLSGTGTFARNIVNAAVGAGEEGAFGHVASRISSKLTGESVGGGFGKGTLSGFGKGVRNVVDAAKGRAADAGKNPFEHLKNYATTANQLGDTMIDSQVAHNVLDHYTQDLAKQGYKGQELADRASVMARQDPQDLSTYLHSARAAAGLGSGITKASKPETLIRDSLSKFLSGGHPGQTSDVVSKLITRMAVGFPTAVTHTVIEGGKRSLVGIPTALKLFSKESREKPAVRAQILKESIKQAGSGATTGALFYQLGKRGLVTGSYPSDPATRAQWKREGITENSVKIDGNYYQLPSYLGSAALPALFAATLGRNGGNMAQTAAEVGKAIPSILPTSQISNVLDWVNGKTDSGKFLTQTAASAVRAVTPVGAALAQVAKSFDPTANNTTSGSALSNFMDKVLTGIPGENVFAHIPDKTDDAGNVIKNPGALPLALGASSAEQGKGVQETKGINNQVNQNVKAISDSGALKDSTLRGILDDKTKVIYDQANSGKQVSPADLKKLQTALTKGVDGTTDNAYLEKGQYDTNLAALKVKRSVMAADPTAKPSDIAKVDLSIKRGQVYKQDKIPYDMITSYEKTSVGDWRAMGNPKSDAYDPAMYQKLYDIDSAMAKGGGSYNSKDPSANKYSAKAVGSGRGANGGAGSYNSSFGQLKGGAGAPSVKAYETISQSSGSVPVIPISRPNIVHKIGGN